MEEKRVANYLRYGEAGYYVENGPRRIERKDRFINTLPTCICYENGAAVAEMDVYAAIDFLFGEG